MISNRLFIISTSFNEELGIGAHIDYLNKLFNRYGIGYVIIDGGSTDNTPSILKKNPNQEGVLFTRGCTIYQAWNLGLECAKKDQYIAFLGVGDRLDELYINDILEIIRQKNRYDIFYGSLNIRSKVRLNVSSSKKDWTCLPFPHAGTFFGKKLFEKTGGFDESYIIAGDLEWLLRLNSLSRVGNFSIKYRYIDKGLVYMRPDGISTGNSKYILKLINETFRAHYLYKTPISIKRVLYFVFAYFKYVIK
jgi:glycosyltransferase involved in cell wall biosynthesis